MSQLALVPFTLFAEYQQAVLHVFDFALMPCPKKSRNDIARQTIRLYIVNVMESWALQFRLLNAIFVGATFGCGKFPWIPYHVFNLVCWKLTQDYDEIWLWNQWQRTGPLWIVVGGRPFSDACHLWLSMFIRYASDSHDMFKINCLFMISIINPFATLCHYIYMHMCLYMYIPSIWQVVIDWKEHMYLKLTNPQLLSGSSHLVSG